MNRIRAIRVEKNWTQDDLAEKLNTKRQTVSHYETGRRGLDMDTICRLCDIIGCTADYLLGRSNRQTPELSPEEEQLLAAWAAAPPEIRAIVQTALAPYREDATASAPTA